MKCVRLALILCGLVFVSTPYVHATDYNAGFVEGMWFSEQPVFAEQTNRVYVAIRNNTGSDLTGRIVFYDNDKRLSSQAVSALDGRIIEAWADWSPAYGEHELRAELEKVTLDVIGGSDESIDVPYSSVNNELFVDYDTDEDGVGNEEDTDDDNDGISDEEEIENGTDPLTPEPEEETGDDDEDKETTEEDDSEDNDSDDNRTGLERYLSETQFKKALEQLTGAINTTSNNLDSYRDNRNDNLRSNDETSTEEPTETNPDANSEETASTSSSTPQSIFGEVERKSGESKNETRWNAVKDFFKHNLQVAYSFLLTVLSALLYRPMLVQIIFLLLILYLLYRLAKKMGNRRNVE